MDGLTKETRYNSIDLVKFIASFGVVAAHVIGTSGDPLRAPGLELAEQIWQVLINIPVPFFFLASGFLLARKMEYPYTSPGSLARMRRSIRSFVRMYLLASLAYLPLAVWHYVQNGDRLLNGVAYYIRDLLFVGDHYLSWQLWYLLATIVALLLLLVMLRRSWKPSLILGLSIALYGLGIACDIIQAHGPAMGGIAAAAASLLEKTWRNGRIFFGALYLFAGMLLSRRRLPVKAAAALMAVSACVFAAVTDEEINRLFIPAYTIPFFSLTAELRLKDRKVYPVLRRLSTCTYLIHTYVWLFISLPLYGRMEQSIGLWAAVSTVCVLLGLIWTRISARQRKGPGPAAPFHRIMKGA